MILEAVSLALGVAGVVTSSLVALRAALRTRRRIAAEKRFAEQLMATEAMREFTNHYYQACKNAKTRTKHLSDIDEEIARLQSIMLQLSKKLPEWDRESIASGLEQTSERGRRAYAEKLVHEAATAQAVASRR